MGRELRRVPANWNHPKYGEQRTNRDSIYYCRAANHHRGDEQYMSLFDRSYKKAATDWIAEFTDWHVNGKKESDICEYYWEYAGAPPEAEMYVSYDPDDESVCTWYQLYETISEGTPATPPFEKPEDLIEYLCTKGDFWQQSDQREGRIDSFRGKNYSREAATEMVLGGGYAPSFVMINGRLIDGPAAMAELKANSSTDSHAAS